MDSCAPFCVSFLPPHCSLHFRSLLRAPCSLSPLVPRERVGSSLVAQRSGVHLQGGRRGSAPCWDDPLEEGMAAHSSTLAGRIPRTEEPGGLQSMGWQKVRHACSG